MFTERTEWALAHNMRHETGIPGLVTLTDDVYRELVFAARQWDAMRTGPVNHGAVIALVPQRDGSIRIEPGPP